MVSRLCVIFALSTATLAQEDASGLARSGLGEVVGASVRVGAFNPSGLAWIDDGQSTISIVPALFGVSELRRAGAVVSYRFGSIGTAATINVLQAGSSQYVGGRASVGFPLSDDVGVGVDALLARWSFPTYAPRYESALGVGVDVRSGPAESGGSIRLRVQQGRAISVRDLSAGVGCSIDAGDDIRISVECLQEPIVPVAIRCAVVAKPIESLTLILSWAESPGVVGSGIGCEVSGWAALFGAQWHPLLGWTQALDLTVSWD
jgi:hypothetical protein